MRLVAVGKILKPQGRRGEVKLLALTDDPGCFEDLEALYVLDTGERRRVEAFWRHADGAPVLKLEGINDIGEAEALRGKLVGLPEAALRPLPASRYYWWSLLGCKVVTESGRPLGMVQDVQDNPAHYFLVVRDGDRETLIPFIQEIVTAVFPDEERIVVRPPQGLLEL